MWEDTVMSDEAVKSELEKRCYPAPRYWDEIDITRKAQAKITWDKAIREALIRVGREAKRMDKTTYLVPDYKKYRQALKDEGVE